MRLQHKTEVAAKPDDVWAFLQNTAAVVECMPGAQLVADLGDDRYDGVLKVAIGPLKMNYSGRASIAERDVASRRLVLDATGRDKRGSGSVVAHVALQVEADGHGSRIDVVSDIDLTGRIASLGRGIGDVSNQMFADFAARLVDRIENPAVAASSESHPTSSPPLRSFTEQIATKARTESQPSAPSTSGEISVLPLLWAVTRERVAGFLERLSIRVRPN